MKLCDADTVITPARIGPAHGAYTNPRPAPTSRPDQNPPSPWLRALRALALEPMRLRRASSWSPSFGIRSATPNPIRVRIASVRSRLSGRPSAEITYTSATVANVNDSARPVTTPSGRRRPPVTPADNATGSTGSTQGDSAVAAPATNANAIRTIMCC
ncbi:MAG TPA: hypothetical protein VLJ42_03760 [Solirubrobacteraceae bacterium]|nr:hypothetical protein [Solirubrobacteraceae bacterium]